MLVDYCQSYYLFFDQLTFSLHWDEFNNIKLRIQYINLEMDQSVIQRLLNQREDNHLRIQHQAHKIALIDFFKL